MSSGKKSPAPKNYSHADFWHDGEVGKCEECGLVSPYWTIIIHSDGEEEVYCQDCAVNGKWVKEPKKEPFIFR